MTAATDVAVGITPGDGYGARVNTLLDRLGSDLSEQDFADLAMACLDQAMLPVRVQLDVHRIVDRALETRTVRS